MKKILFLLLFATIGLTVYTQAQSYNGKIGDTTITNAASPSYILPVVGPKTNVTFQYVITKTSGTVAGNIVLAGTIDGVTWFTLNTYTLTDATATTAIAYNLNSYTKYKVTINTTGTQVSNHKVWVLYR
jgi:hypothetical protein